LYYSSRHLDEHQMKKLALLLIIFSFSVVNAQQKSDQSKATDTEVHVERENIKAFLDYDLDRYVVYDLMSDGTKVFKDTLDFNEYRDKAIFTITQNQTILNRQLWATITLLTITIGLLLFIIKKK